MIAVIESIKTKGIRSNSETKNNIYNRETCELNKYLISSIIRI